mgnify:FL=1
MNEYLFQLQVIGLGADEDDALHWALQQLGKKNTDVLQGEIVYEMVEDKEQLDSDAMIKPDDWLTVTPEG